MRISDLLSVCLRNLTRRRVRTALTVIGATTAMSTPHEIEYTLNFSSASLQAAGE